MANTTRWLGVLVPSGSGSGISDAPVAMAVPRRRRVLNQLSLDNSRDRRPQWARWPPSPFTMERTACAAIYFEQYYDALRRDPPRRRHPRVTEGDYINGRVIGQGAFGVVRIATERSTGQIVAIKALRKADILRLGQEAHVRSERAVLAAAASVFADDRPGNPCWLPRIHAAFQDEERLYLALEYMGGGDLLTLLMGRGRLPESTMRFYAAEMVLALAQVHALGYIHRDVKPDNFLFSKDGHVRIADFGLARDLGWSGESGWYDRKRKEVARRCGLERETGGSLLGRRSKGGRGNSKAAEALRGAGRQRAYTICGTNSYMAPEVVRGHGYGFTADWWGLGIIIYEALFGAVPFMAHRPDIVREMIMEWDRHLEFPSSGASHLARMFMKELICEPLDRLGHVRRAPEDTGLGHDGVEQLMRHAWFDGIHWDTLHLQTPPFRPELVSEADTRHFDNDIPNEPLAQAIGALQLKDPLLNDEVHGEEVARIRKKLAFMDWNYSPDARPAGETSHTPQRVESSCDGVGGRDEVGRPWHAPYDSNGEEDRPLVDDSESDDGVGAGGWRRNIELVHWADIVTDEQRRPYRERYDARREQRYDPHEVVLQRPTPPSPRLRYDPPSGDSSRSTGEKRPVERNGDGGLPSPELKYPTPSPQLGHPLEEDGDESCGTVHVLAEDAEAPDNAGTRSRVHNEWRAQAVARTLRARAGRSSLTPVRAVLESE